MIPVEARCGRCFALVTEKMMKCPDCGYLLQIRNIRKISKEESDFFNELCRKVSVEETKTYGQATKSLQEVYEQMQEINNQKPSEKQLEELAEVINDKVDGGGKRDDLGKFRMDLVPSSMLYAMAKVMEKGAEKYAPNNWRRGMKWSKPYSCLMRHIQKWNDCEDLDSETNLSHLYHALANIAMLIEYETTCPELDDRYKGKVRDYKEF
jgi:predicted  nucleic acid-binding Zn-ribbon protein